jgi:hypothetical protein
MTRIRISQGIFAEAATVAALALLSAAGPADTGTAVASGPAPASAPFATDDTNSVNDLGQTSGDIFTQNAFSQIG